MISDKDLLSRQQARQLAQKAREAANILAGFSQSQIDAVVDAAANAADVEAETLAKMAVEETTYGKVSDKIIKNRFSSRDVYRFIRPLKTAGVIGEDKERKLILVAEPVGVVAAILPSTNPTSTAIYKILISIKARNSIVLSPHPSAKKCICHAAEVMSRAAVAAGAPEGIITCLTDVSSEGTQELMHDRNVSVILATGGMGIVRLAYSSGKPAFGVGPGNVPAFIERSANVPKAVRDIILGKTFDNGVLCSSEQSIICESAIRDQVLDELKKQKAYFLNDKEIDAVGKVAVTSTFGANPRIVGKTAGTIASVAGITVPADTSVLIAPLKGVGKDYPLSIEKLSPILAYYEVPDFQSGIELCVRLVRFGGMGHTMAMHSNNQQLIVEAGIKIPVFRLIINSPATHGSIGLTTGLDPAMTLGCGAVGGNITSDNIGPVHLMNIKRIAIEIREATQINFEQQPARPSGNSVPSLEDKIAGFLDRKGLKEPIAPPIVKQRVEPVPPPQSASIQSTSIQLGEHKIYPVRTAGNLKLAISVPANPKGDTRLIGPLDVVCEDDVRQAINNEKIIAIHGKTILTPAARDLAGGKNIFKKID